MNFLKPGDFNFQQHCLETYGSIENLIDKAKNGEIIAQADLGMAYSEGFGDLLPKDNDKAIGWLNTAVERGYEFPSILGKLGELLDLKGTPLYQRKAYEMYHRAAKLGCTSSQINLAEMYRCGVEGVVNEDLKESFKWLKKAAGESLTDDEDLGVFSGLLAGTMKKVENAVVGSRHRALRLLYQYYLEGNCPEGQPQPSKAVHYLTRAAEQGDNESQLNLGQIYLTGDCEQVKDIGMARRWLGKASACGDDRARQLLQECKQCTESQDDTLELSQEAVNQTGEILLEKLSQRYGRNLHPLTLTKPVAFSEEMLSKFDWSPTARNYLQAFKLVKEGFAILYKSNFTNGRGVSLIAHGFLTENTILQAFPQKHILLPEIFQLCERNLWSNSQFFEGLVLSYALHPFESRVSEESSKVDSQKAMCLLNMINLIQRAEPNGSASKNPLRFEENYSNWLHILYWHLAVIFVVGKAHEKAVEAAENSLKCCPSYIESKRLLGFALMELCGSKSRREKEDSQQKVPTEWMPKENTSNTEVSKYASWTTEKMRNTAMEVLKEFLVEAPPCHRFYSNVYYYLAQMAFEKNNIEEFKRYYELGQDAEEKRLPFFDPDDVPPNKVWLSTFYQLLPNIQKLDRLCGNKACTRKVKKTELKSCAGCGVQKYCSKDCQKADWKNHKAACIAFRRT